MLTRSPPLYILHIYLPYPHFLHLFLPPSLSTVMCTHTQQTSWASVSISASLHPSNKSAAPFPYMPRKRRSVIYTSQYIEKERERVGETERGERERERENGRVNAKVQIYGRTLLPVSRRMRESERENSAGLRVHVHILCELVFAFVCIRIRRCG